MKKRARVLSQPAYDRLRKEAIRIKRIVTVDLPEELWAYVFDFLQNMDTFPQIAKFRLVCKLSRKIADENLTVLNFGRGNFRSKSFFLSEICRRDSIFKAILKPSGFEEHRFVASLTNLTSLCLHLDDGGWVRDVYSRSLTNLRSLRLRCYPKFATWHPASAKNVRSLHVIDTKTTVDHLRHYENLTTLKMIRSSKINVESFEGLTGLTKLHVRDPRLRFGEKYPITERDLGRLTGLKDLILPSKCEHDGRCVSKLTRLLRLDASSKFFKITNANFDLPANLADLTIRRSELFRISIFGKPVDFVADARFRDRIDLDVGVLSRSTNLRNLTFDGEYDEKPLPFSLLLHSAKYVRSLKYVSLSGEFATDVQKLTRHEGETYLRCMDALGFDFDGFASVCEEQGFATFFDRNFSKVTFVRNRENEPDPKKK